MTVNSILASFLARVGLAVSLWNRLPPKQLTRRGLMELSDEH